MAIANGRVPGGVRAWDRVSGRWDYDLDRRTDMFRKDVACWLSVICAIRQKKVNRAVDLIEQIWQGCRISNKIRDQIGADDLTANKIKTQV